MIEEIKKKKKPWRGGLGFFFNGIPTFLDYLINTKSVLVEELQCVHTFLKGISPKVNVTARLSNRSENEIVKKRKKRVK